MVYVFALLLFVVVLVFGVGSVMNSYAQVQQAEAVRAVARVAEVNAWGNLVVILVVALVVLLVIGVVVWMVKRSSTAPLAKSARGSAQTGASSSAYASTGAQQVDVNMLLQLEMLKTMRSMQQLPAPASTITQQVDENESVEMMYWLRQ
jgi:hypothetical protein